MEMGEIKWGEAASRLKMENNEMGRGAGGEVTGGEVTGGEVAGGAMRPPHPTA